jgi:hypothetical protein
MRRKMASGRVLWLARYTRPDGTCAYWKLEWNGGRATFKHKWDAQRAIDEAHLYHAATGGARPTPLGRTSKPGRPVTREPSARARRMSTGVLTILRSLSAMAEDAITDDLAARSWLHPGYIGTGFGFVMR